MGFFSKLFTAAPPAPFVISDEREAFASILFACVMADGSSSEEERTQFVSTLMSRPLFAFGDASNIIYRAIKNCERTSNGALLVDAAIGAITSQNREPLFLYCVDIILADGQVTSQEEEILDYLKAKLGISDALAQKAVEIFMLKNRV